MLVVAAETGVAEWRSGEGDGPCWGSVASPVPPQAAPGVRAVHLRVLPAVHPVRVVGPSRSSLSGLNPALGTPRARAAPRREINIVAMPGPENTRSCTVTRRDSCRVLWPMPHALSTHTACCVARAPRASALRTHSCDHLPVAPTLAHSFLKPRCRSAGSKQPRLDVYVAWRSGRTFSPW